MAQVRSLGASGARFAARTSSSAAAWAEKKVSFGGFLFFLSLFSNGGKKADIYLSLGVVLALGLATDHRPPLIGIDQIAPVIANDTSRARVHKRLDARLLARLDHGRGPVHIDLLEQGVGNGVAGLRGGRRGVDDHIGLDLRKDGLELGGVGDVGVEVGHAVRVGPPVARTPQVND